MGIEKIIAYILLIIMVGCVIKVTYKLGYIEGYIKCNEDIKQFKELEGDK